ncbi:MAG: molybdopterin-dependent oxidoreductase [Akkermansiaceae bacterium]|nr:molybdopterin-dependent oxidoreductase [Akkermansiaceae bacterium]MCP5551966.1 molybdopterin-dependent oxidoreductase [Akkermansiaceae bacterium]
MSDEQKPAVEMVDVQIDGEWHQFPKGTRMIEACRQAGRDVPHYCYHPKLSSPGNCRMCLVEMGMPPRPRPGEELKPDEDGHLPIQWIPRPAIACANTVAPNMGIRTDSELTRACRHGVMELLLINHPLDCPICDQAGECRLQEFSVEHGNGASRFRENKVKKPKNVAIGPRVRLDDERCIMCSRCIRFADEIADDPVLGFTDRGSHTTLAVHPGRELANNYSLNTVDICPVGALTSNDFRFQMRVWFLKETESICTSCGRGCNLTIGGREGEVHRLTPRQNDAVNSAWMCDHGRLNFHYLNSELRLTDPLIRGEAGHETATWAQALKTAAAALAGFGPNEVAVIASGRLTNEELFMARQFAAAVKSEFIDIVPRLGEADDYLAAADRNPNTLGAKLILGLENPGAGLKSIRDGIAQGRIKALVALQENLVDDAGFSAGDLGKLEFLLATYPLANPTAEAADVVLPGAGFAEKRGSMINLTGRLQRLNRAHAGPGQTREPWEILRDLIQELGGGNGIYRADDVFAAMAAEIKEFAGLKLADLPADGVALLDTGETVPLLDRERERKAKGVIVG